MHHHQSGFSLPSLLIGLALLTSLASITLSGTQRWLDNRHALADRADFAALIEYARLSPLLSGKSLVLCPAPASWAQPAMLQRSVHDSIECGSQWSDGVVLLQPAATPTLKRHFVPSPRIQLTGPAMPLVFRTDTSTNLVNATFVFASKTAPRYALVLNRTGRTRYTLSPNANIDPLTYTDPHP